MNNRFVIVSALYNAEGWVDKSILSVKKQKYKNYIHVIVDDMSTDKSAEIIERTIAGDKNTIFIKNESKKCSLENIHDAILNHSEDNDIIVILDGDDFLASPDVLSKLNDFYNENECLLTYGSYINLSDRKRGKFSKEIPDWVIEKSLFREYAWCTSHLRSFKSHLFKSIKTEDLKDENGDFYNMAGDLVIMFPMLEMAGFKGKYVKDILYIWNDLNTYNEHKVDNVRQVSIERLIRSKEKYNVIK